MVTRVHIKIGKATLRQLGKVSNKFKTRSLIIKPIFLLGCVAPDLNCVYPPHNIWATSERYQKRIRKIHKTRRFGLGRISKSFSLGILMHYTCDYFCLPHNRRAYGKTHLLYEKRMSKLLNKDMALINSSMTLGYTGLQRVIKDIHGSLDEQIYLQILSIHDRYLELIDNIGKNWGSNIEQMKTDLHWAITNCINLSAVLLPDICMDFTIEDILEMSLLPFGCWFQTPLISPNA